MQFTVIQENLAKGLSIVTAAIAKRPSLQILANVLITAQDNKIRLTATDLEMGVVVHLPGKIETDGAITVPAKLLEDYVKTLPKTAAITLSIDAKTLTLKLKCGSSQSNFKGISADEYPAVPEADANTGMVVRAAALDEMIKQVIFAAAREDNRPILMGVSTRFKENTLTLAAADGYRLAIRTTELDAGVDEALNLIVPAVAYEELSKIILRDEESRVYVSIPPGRNQIMFHTDVDKAGLISVDMTCQLIDGTYPDIEKIIPKSHRTSTIVNANALLGICRQAEIFAREASNTTLFKITPGESELVPGTMVVQAQSQERGDNEGSIPAKIKGSGLEISFNVKYVMDVLGVIKEDDVILETNEASSACVVRPVNRPDFIHVVMPLSIPR
jgi:DNA polymerase-3 subunit beta